jgi:hypothetical protein
VRIPSFLFAVAVIGCGGGGDQPEKVVRDYLQSEGSASCDYLTAQQAKLCRLPRIPDSPSDEVVIEGIRVQGNEATIRASYN